MTQISNGIPGVFSGKVGTLSGFTRYSKLYACCSKYGNRQSQATVITNGAANLQFAWVNNTEEGTAKASDKALLFADFPELKQIIF